MGLCGRWWLGTGALGRLDETPSLIKRVPDGLLDKDGDARRYALQSLLNMKLVGEASNAPGRSWVKHS
jgi:hypothetical protein